ncbi:MAG: DUF4345 domain-containing protein [Polyangiaceae bacterium]
MSKRALQVTMALLALIPVATGVVGLLGLRDPLYVRSGVVPNVVLDSNLRFFAGVWLGVGLSLFAILPRIERHGPLFRALWGMIFLGGVGRVVSIVDAGMPSAPFLGVLALELLGAPLFVLWQRRVERQR